MQANLGPQEPRWAPTSEGEIRAAVESGHVAESHFIDAKRETGNSLGDRKETARDLASYALDGGALLFGVDEDKANHRMRLYPRPLNGLIEKIDNIAAMSIEPPLTVICREIPSDTDPSVGYVLAHVPPSPVAPHMVDGRYYARAERTRRVLHDAEVLRLHSHRESVEAQTGRLLDVEIDRDPVPGSDRDLGHMYLVAQPIAGPSNIAHALTRIDPDAALQVVTLSQPQLYRTEIASFAPTLEGACTRVNRANGVGLCSHSLSGPGRTCFTDHTGTAPDDGSLLDVELRDDGGIRVLVGRMTVKVNRSYNGDTEGICDGLAVAYARRLIHWAVEIGERTGWRGSWMLGVHGDRLRSLGSHLHLGGMTMGRVQTYDEEVYREVTSASHLEMQQRPRVVACRLVGRLAETLGSFPNYRADLTGTDGAP